MMSGHFRRGEVREEGHLWTVQALSSCNYDRRAFLDQRRGLGALWMNSDPGRRYLAPRPSSPCHHFRFLLLSVNLSQGNLRVVFI